MADSPVVRRWVEHDIVKERGSRLVHYILEDITGNSVLAVVGKERCMNDMAYTISEDFLRVFGSTSTVHAREKWKTREEVVEWLTHVVERGIPILANPISRKRNNTRTADEKVECSAPKGRALQGSKRVKTCPLSQVLERSCTRMTDSNEDHGVKWEPTCNKVKITLPSKRLPILALPAFQLPCSEFPKVNQNIELLSQDSGVRGCWFRCKVLFSSKTRLKVQHKDVLQVDGAGKLEEWVPACRKVASDKLGVRCVGRLTVRPQRCVDSSYSIAFTVGAAVDVWRCNGWWEGVVIGYETLTNTNLQVYFPGENSFSTAARKNIRVSRDWFNENWVDVRPRPDILSFLSSILSPGPEPTPHPVFTEANSSATNSKVPRLQTLEEPEVKRWKVPSSTASTSLKSAARLNLKKRLISKDPSPRTLEEVEVDKWKVLASSTASTSLKSAARLNLKKRLISRYNEDIKIGRL